jgi:hypothetical protein
MLAAAVCARAANLCVAPDGDDRNPGTKQRPFATIQRSQQAANPGDIVWIRGGTYQLRESQIARRDSFLAAITHLDKSGTRDQPIRYFAFPGEQPVFDCSQVKPQGLRVHAFRVRGSWIHLKGLEVTGVQVTATGHTQSICYENLGDHNTYELLRMHDGQAIGLYITRGAHNLVLNCDAWRNHDHTSEGGRGGNTDGFGCHVPSRGANNVFRGCRAWLNSDDGFDCISSADAVSFINCWAFQNGYSADLRPRGDGNGFKAGGYGVDPGRRFPSPLPRHRIERCLAAGNRSAGFYANHHPGGCDWIHNSAARNAVNFNFLGRATDGNSDIPGQGHRIINNLAYGGKRDTTNLDFRRCQVAGNSFDPPRKLSERDFLGLDLAELAAPRQANGELPEIRFLRLARGSPLIDSGSRASGAPFHGRAPDPGAFESR